MGTATLDKPVRIRRTKSGKTAFAREVDAAGVVTEWTPKPAGAARFDGPIVDRVLSRAEASHSQGRPVGLIEVLSDAGETLRAVGEEVVGLASLEADGSEIDVAERYRPGLPPCDVGGDGARPVLRLALIGPIFTPARLSSIAELTDCREAVEDLVKTSPAVQAYFGVKKHIRDFDSNGEERAAAAARVQELERERDAQAADLESPDLARRLRDADAKLGEARQKLADFRLDREALTGLLARNRPAAVREVQDAAVRARKARKQDLLDESREIVQRIADESREDLSRLHEVWSALFQLDREWDNSQSVVKGAAVHQVLGPAE